MKIDRISIQKVFPIGLYQTERIGLEASIDEGDNIDECFSQLKGQVEKFFKENNPELHERVYGSNGNWVKELDDKIDKEQKQSAEQRMLTAINTCESIPVLETFKLLVKNNPTFQEAYNKKLEELSK